MGATITNWIRFIVSNLVVLLCTQLTGCYQDANYAPVTDLNAVVMAYHPVKKVEAATVKKHRRVSDTYVSTDRLSWVWPASGKILMAYSPGNKGINIGGMLGDPIVASATGRVVYAGNGLRGYGNLIIIKHNSQYISAYAHTKVMLVKTGQWVKKKQKIAQMGNSGTNRVMLHFEVRRDGKPINPASIQGIMN